MKKASKKLHILRFLEKSGLVNRDLLDVYNSLIRSVLEYACPVWSCSLPKYLSDKIELVQKRAFRVIIPGCHYSNALEITGCSRLDERRLELCKTTFKKICDDTSSKLNHLVPKSRGEAHGRCLRNSASRTLPKSRTERYKNSFIPAMCYL